ncbi:MAG: outer membrane beta-barrel protein [Chroococcales cyanobacterium]
MKGLFKSIATLSAISAVAIAPIFLSANKAYSQPVQTTRGTDANYIGAGAAAGVTNGGQDGDAATFGGNIQGRYAVRRAPVSVRGSVLFSDETSAIIPMVSYDVPVARNTNLYVGAGYSFVESDGKPTPLGNSDAPVVAVGGETQVGQNIIIYGDTKLGIEAYEDSPASAVSVQLGAGYRFK